MDFKLLDDKKKNEDLKPDDHITVNDMLYRIINNFRVAGGGRRMLMMAFHTHQEPQGYKFLEVASETRVPVFVRID